MEDIHSNSEILSVQRRIPKGCQLSSKEHLKVTRKQTVNDKKCIVTLLFLSKSAPLMLFKVKNTNKNLLQNLFYVLQLSML